MRILLSILLLLLAGTGMTQPFFTSEKKRYKAGTAAGEVMKLEEWTESDGRQSSVVYLVDVKQPGNYFIKITGNMNAGSAQQISADGGRPLISVEASRSGWQQAAAVNIGKIPSAMWLGAGKHLLRFTVKGDLAPLHEGISFSMTNSHRTLDADWQHFSGVIDRLAAQQPESMEPINKTVTGQDGKVLSNPSGHYEHAIDTAFTYTTFAYVTLTGGVSYNFKTKNSTVDPVLHLFDPNNIETRSWYDDDSGTGYESDLTVTPPATATYVLLVRPYTGGMTGTTTIVKSGVDYLVTTPLGGQRYTAAQRTGVLNYSTCRLVGNANSNTPDTRIFTLSFAGGAITGYNDDYANTSGGTWNWGYASRIKKNYTSGMGNSIVFVCAYSAGRTGTSDVYMGNPVGQLHETEPYNFPNLATEDAIQSAPNTFNTPPAHYNCISWSGGVTSTDNWPPGSYSIYYVAGNPLASFDKFYSNTPVRYPGAWNYTRTGATAANAVVDLWKTSYAYTHASVTKPGNDHPHGYDWESKPGYLDRQFHPRNALEYPSWYGAVSDYYKPTGTFARGAGADKGFATDAEAVEAGLAVYENARLSLSASGKLSLLTGKAEPAISSRYNTLYDAWQKTWAANASLSNPDAYCMNREYEALERFCDRYPEATLLLTMDKMTSRDMRNGKLLLHLSGSRYGHLLEEVKQEVLSNPVDAQGRYRIIGDPDNAIHYVEKILQGYAAAQDGKPAPVTFTVTASPNPVADILTITVVVKEDSRMGVKVISSQTGNQRILLQESNVKAGQYQYTINRKGFAGATGDMVVVQVMVNGVLQTVKVLAG